MPSETSKRGGPGRGQGRKPVKQGEDTVTLSLRVTLTQREKLARLGGAEWVRGKIDKAKEPNVKVTGAPPTDANKGEEN
jgi:hypothetical protein